MRCSWQYEQAPAGIRPDVVRVLQKLGLTVRRQHRSHIIMRRDDPFAQTVVPNHTQIDRGTLRAILRQTEITTDEFIGLL